MTFGTRRRRLAPRRRLAVATSTRIRLQVLSRALGPAFSCRGDAAVSQRRNLIPVLIEQVPTLENGLLAKDGKSVTYTLKEGLAWSDGTPFTTDDVIFNPQHEYTKRLLADVPKLHEEIELHDLQVELQKAGELT